MSFLLPKPNSACHSLLSLRLAAFARQSHKYRLYVNKDPPQALSAFITTRGIFSSRPCCDVAAGTSPPGQPPGRQDHFAIRQARLNSYHRNRYRSNTLLLYFCSVAVGFVGMSYMAVPLYRLFCQTTGLGGTVQTDVSRFTEKDYVPVRMSERIKITFNADRSRALPWSFAPQQRDVRVLPGETALAFFTASNLSDRDIIGVSTYNITPAKAGVYFNKIQCFCFEEQMLRAGEEVDMPVFFFIDPEFATDPNMNDVKTITLSYTFFESRHNKLI